MASDGGAFPRPIGAEERIDAIDVLRGVALLGVLVGAGVIAGVAVGLAVRPPAEPAGDLATQEVRF